MLLDSSLLFWTRAHLLRERLLSYSPYTPNITSRWELNSTCTQRMTISLPAAGLLASRSIYMMLSPFFFNRRVGETGIWDDLNGGLRTPDNKTHLEITGLSPYTVYSFRLAAVNALGRSAPSQPSYPIFTLREGEIHTTSIYIQKTVIGESKFRVRDHRLERIILFTSILASTLPCWIWYKRVK
jgi:hypothetical protein